MTFSERLTYVGCWLDRRSGSEGRPHVGLPSAGSLCSPTLTIKPGKNFQTARADRLIRDDWAGDETGGRGGLPHVENRWANSTVLP